MKRILLSLLRIHHYSVFFISCVVLPITLFAAEKGNQVNSVSRKQTLNNFAKKKAPAIQQVNNQLIDYQHNALESVYKESIKRSESIKKDLEDLCAESSENYGQAISDVKSSDKKVIDFLSRFLVVTQALDETEKKSIKKLMN